MAVIGEHSIHERLLAVQAELEKAQQQYNSVVRTVGEILYENEQLVKGIRDMVFQIHWEHPEKATEIGIVTLARFGAETAEEGQAQSPIQA